MLYLKPMNLDDAQKEYDFLKATPSEHGFCNDYDETSYEDFVAVEIPKRLAIACMLLHSRKNIKYTTLSYIWIS